MSDVEGKLSQINTTNLSQRNTTSFHIGWMLTKKIA